MICVTVSPVEDSHKKMSTTEYITKTQFLVVIKNISELTTFESEKVFVRGQPWFMKFAKIDDYLCVHLHLLNEVSSDDWSMVATFSVKLVRSENLGKQPQHAIGPVIFDSNNTGWGYDSFIEWDRLMDPENGYVTNDESIFKVKIKAGPIQNASSNEWLNIETNRKCCDDSSYGNFDLTIKKLYQSFAICSPKFNLNKNQWRILAIKGVDFKLFLWNAESNVWPFYTISKCELKSFDENIRPIQKKTKNTDAIQSPLEIFSIPWMDLNSQEKRYIEDGKFKLKVEIKIDHPEEASTNANFPCSICFENMIGRNVSVTECGHLFCTECIKSSFLISPRCPMCKKRIGTVDLTSDDSDSDDNRNRNPNLRRVYLPANW